MGRRTGVMSTLIAIHRAGQRERVARARAEVRAARQAERLQRTLQRERAAEEKERARAYTESRLEEVRDQNADLEETVSELRSLLHNSLILRASAVDLEGLKEKAQMPAFEPGPLRHAIQAPEINAYLPPPPGWLGKLIPGAEKRHVTRSIAARARFEMDTVEHAEREQKRQEELRRLRAEHERKVETERLRIEAQHAEIDDFKRRFQERQPEAVAAYFALALDKSTYPPSFACTAEFEYNAASKLLVCEIDLPEFEVVPTTASVKYVKSKDEIVEVPRPARDRRELYSSVIAQTTLRTLHEIFSADSQGLVETIVLNGYVTGTDRSTGRSTTSCVVSVRAPSDTFLSFDLGRVEPLSCLASLHAVLSKSPESLTPVRPLLGTSAIDRAPD